MSVFDTILEPELYPELYGKYHHKVRIDYYPPRGDAKEGWDNIDIARLAGHAHADQDQLPLPGLDPGRADRPGPGPFPWTWPSARASRASRSGCPSTSRARSAARTLKPEHDLFIQHLKLKNTLRLLMGEEVLDHSGPGLLRRRDGSRRRRPGPASPPPKRKAIQKKQLARSRKDRLAGPGGRIL